MPQFSADGMEQNRELLELLYKMAEEKNATPAQISLAWMLCKKPYIGADSRHTKERASDRECKGC